MQALSEFAPLVAFLIAYRLDGIYTATAVLMVAMVLLLVVDLLRTRRIPPMHLISTVLVLLLGGATLVMRDPRFLKWKPTIFLWVIAVAAAASAWIGREPLAQRLLGPVVADATPLPRQIWLRLNWLWVGFYLLCGAANLWVAQNASERAWVNFKVFGLTAAFLVFALVQAGWLSQRAHAGAAAK